MDDPQSATVYFFAPVAAAYLAACGAWLLYARLRPSISEEPPLRQSDRPYLDAALALATAAAILALGSVYRHGWLLPASDTWPGRAGWLVDNLIIFSPIAIVLIIRRQGAETIFLSPRRLAEKVALGLVLGAASVAIYLALRGELAQLGSCLATSAAPKRLNYFAPVFLEGVALAFGFVRLRWAVGTPAALAIPAVLFAAAHVPGQLANERTFLEIALFFAFNSVLVAVILWTAQRSRDVVWLGMVHYLMDVAIKAF